MAITDLEAAQQMAEKYPDLHESRQRAFGQNYLQDLEQGTGTSQYYTGFGLAPDWVTGAIGTPAAQEPAPVVQQPVVQDPTTMIPQTGGGEGITGASVVQPTIQDPTTMIPQLGSTTMDQAGAVAAMTPDDAYSLDTPPITDQAGAVAAMTQDDAYSLDSPAPNALEQDIAQVAKDTTQAEFDALAPEIGYGVGEVDPKLAEAAGIVDYSDPNIDAMYTDDRIVSEEKALDPFAYTDRIMDPKLMEIQQQNYQDPSFWDTVKSTYSTDGISGVAANFGQSVADAFSGLAEQGINVGKMAGSAIMNAIAPGLGLIAGMLPEGGRSEMSNKLGAQYGMDDIGRLTSGPMQGYSVGPNFSQTIQDRIDNINETLNNMTPEQLATTTLKDRVKDLEGMKSVVDYDRDAAIDEGIQTAEDDKDPEDIGFDTVADEEFAETGDYDVYAGGGADQDPVGPDFGDTDYADPGVDAEENQPTPSGDGADRDSAPSAPSGGPYGGGPGGIHGGETTSGPSESGVTSANAPPSQGGGSGGPPSQGGGSPGSGKIVCTMMNESYGFGSFRNKIWLKHSKDLAPEYQIGYHKIFLPLVRLSKTNKLLKKTLEHIAIHRTIDIRQEARGKVHLLGRIYRKILEPICYIVGKYAKR